MSKIYLDMSLLKEQSAVTVFVNLFFVYVWGDEVFYGYGQFNPNKQQTSIFCFISVFLIVFLNFYTKILQKGDNFPF